MGGEELEALISDVHNALGRMPDKPPPTDVTRAMDPNHSWWGLSDLSAESEFRATESGLGDPEAPPPIIPMVDPIWKAIRLLKSLLCLVPVAPGGNTRLGQCIAAIRSNHERDQFPALDPDLPSAFNIRMIAYPQLEVNQFIEEAKPMILELLEHVEIESRMRERLIRELRKPDPYLELDDRGTIKGFMQPTGPTKEQQRNDARLEALAVFLGEVQKRSNAVLHAASRILAGARVALDRWFFDVRAGKLRHGEVEATNLSPEAVLYMKMVVEAHPKYAPFKQLKARARNEGIEVSSSKLEQIKKQLPPHFLAMLDFSRGVGASLKS